MVLGCTCGQKTDTSRIALDFLSEGCRAQNWGLFFHSSLVIVSSSLINPTQPVFLCTHQYREVSWGHSQMRFLILTWRPQGVKKYLSTETTLHKARSPCSASPWGRTILFLSIPLRLPACLPPSPNPCHGEWLASLPMLTELPSLCAVTRCT